MQKIVIMLVSLIALGMIYFYIRVKALEKEISDTLKIDRVTLGGLFVSFKVSSSAVNKLSIIQSANLISSTECNSDTCIITLHIINLDDLEVYLYGVNTFFKINLKELIKNKLNNE